MTPEILKIKEYKKTNLLVEEQNKMVSTSQHDTNINVDLCLD